MKHPSLPLLVAALLLPPAAVVAQDQPVVIQSSPAIPNDFRLPPGDGETAREPASPVPRTVTETQPLPEPAQGQAQATPFRAPSASPVSARSASEARRTTPSAAASAATTPATQASAPSEELLSSEPPLASAQAPLPDEAIIEQGVNWPLMGLLIMGAALLALVVFLRRQRFQTVPAKSAPRAPVPRPIAGIDRPEPVPAQPAPPPKMPPKMPPNLPMPIIGDGLVHARMPSSGLVTTNLAAKRRSEASPQPAPPVPPKRILRPPMVRTRISFDGF